MELGIRRRGKWFLLAFVVLALLVALTWDRLALAIAFATSEHRPAQLEDAEWGKPETAAAFRKRFGKGTSEAALLDWLAANRFEIDRPSHRARLMVHGVPCSERVAVSWEAIAGTIRDSQAVVSEAGCL